MQLLSGSQAAQSFFLGALEPGRYLVNIGRSKGNGLLFGYV
jgi:hypothetical protein